MVYKIIPINYNSKLEKLQKNSIKHKFLYQSVKDEIILYEESENSNINLSLRHFYRQHVLYDLRLDVSPTHY